MKAEVQKALTIARAKRALELRRSGLSYRQVGESLDPPVSAARARELIGRAEYLEREYGEIDGYIEEKISRANFGLSTQDKNKLIAAFGDLRKAIDAFRTELIEYGIGNGGIKVGSTRVYGMGRRGLINVLNAVGREVPEQVRYDKPPSQSEITRAINVLRRAGYNVESLRVLDDVKN